MTPAEVSVHLLGVLLEAVEEMTEDGQIDVDHQMLMLGLARVLASMLQQYPREAQMALVPEILETIVSKVPGGKLLVVRKPMTEH